MFELRLTNLTDWGVYTLSSCFKCFLSNICLENTTYDLILHRPIFRVYIFPATTTSEVDHRVDPQHELSPITASHPL